MAEQKTKAAAEPPLDCRVGRYNIGSKSAALRMMARCAIRDQEGLIEAMTPRFGEPDEETQKTIDDCHKWIADFKRIARSTVPN